MIVSSKNRVSGSVVAPDTRPRGPRIAEAGHHPDETEVTAGPVTNPLALDGWIEFTGRVYGLEPRRFQYGGPERDQERLDAILYLDSKGRIRRPERSPYVSLEFRPSPAKYPHKIERQWIALASELAEEMRAHGLVNALPLAPGIQDIRPWQWAGFRVNVNYTFIMDFPHPLEAVSSSVRARARRSEREGFRIERTTNVADIVQCLNATEQRQGFRLGLSKDDLRMAYDLLGDEHFMAMVAYSPSGEPASAVVNLHQPGAVAIYWLRGTRDEYLRTGIAAALELYMYDQLAEAGATGLDLCGANIPGVAAAKATHGARLVPYYSVETYSARRLAKWMQMWWRYARLSRQA